ncbi:sensor histidine kinase [Ascidiimonas aurantiaca]|uniref:sensor histidine kinase n=1 Tax=Ascidiimonas aurantiaca TaxID=1685432 RepID=UPI0030EEFEA2
MNVSSHIADILQLYEFSMSIGKTLEYQENCDNFLKLLLARKNLNICWISSTNEQGNVFPYSLPVSKGFPESPEKSIAFIEALDQKGFPVSFSVNEVPSGVAPTLLKKGSLAVFNMKTQGLLFLHSAKKEQFSERELNQLEPIISKFALSLEACSTYSKQQQLLEDLEKQNQELNNYAHLVSHDLKSPLRNIDALAHWIREDYGEALPQEAQDNLELISENLEKMDLLIHGILRYTTIDKWNNRKSTVNINDVLTGEITALKIPDNVKIEIENSVPSIVASHLLMEQLFKQLIKNALQALHPNGGFICIAYQDLGEYHRFSVKDNGKGIDKKYHQRIFRIFQKLENKGTSSGIGLSIVKKIVDYYEGAVWLNSEPGSGTEVVFTLKKNV